MIRKHTRVYYHVQNPPPSSARVGSVSASSGCVILAARCGQPVPWGVIAPDPTLRAVRRLYEQAVLAKDGAYLNMLNCYYSAIALAYAEWRQSKCRYKADSQRPKFVVAAWGADARHLVFQAIRKKGRWNLWCMLIRRCSPRGDSARMKAMIYPAHPLNPHFASHVPAMATLMAPFV